MTTFSDYLGECVIFPPAAPIRARRAIVLVVTPGFETYLDACLATLGHYGDCAETVVVVMAVNADDACREVIARHGAYCVDCTTRGPVFSRIKGLCYSAFAFIDAQVFLCMDADIVALNSLTPLFERAESDPDTLFICTDAKPHLRTLRAAFYETYHGTPEHKLETWGLTDRQLNYPVAINVGVFACSRAVLQQLHDGIKALPAAALHWAEGDMIGDQFLFNLVCADLPHVKLISPVWNMVDWHFGDRVLWREGTRLCMSFDGEPVRLLHMAWFGKRRYQTLLPLLHDADLIAPLLAEGPSGEARAVLHLLERAHQGALPVARAACEQVIRQLKELQPKHVLVISGEHSVWDRLAATLGCETTLVCQQYPVEPPPRGADQRTVMAYLAQMDAGLQSDLESRLDGYLSLDAQSRRRVCFSDNPERWIREAWQRGEHYDAVLVESVQGGDCALYSCIEWAKALMGAEGTVLFCAGSLPAANQLRFSGFESIEQDGLVTTQWRRDAPAVNWADVETPPVTIAIMLADHKRYALKILEQSLLALDYPKSRIRILALCDGDSPRCMLWARGWLSKQGFAEVDVWSSDSAVLEAQESYRTNKYYLRVFARLARFRQQIMERYLSKEADCGLLFWDADEEWEPHLLKAMTSCGWPLAQGLYVTRHRDYHLTIDYDPNTRNLSQIPIEELPFRRFAHKYCTGGALFVGRDLCEETIRRGGWSRYEVDFETENVPASMNNVGDDGWLAILLNRDTYLVKNVVGWHYSNSYCARGIVVRDGEFHIESHEHKPHAFDAANADIGVVIPAYNCAAFLEKTLKSVQAQDYCRFVTIIVNDASTDNTRELAERVAREDARFALISATSNVGVSRARNIGLGFLLKSRPSLRYFVFMDGDDEWFPDSLETMHLAAEAHPEFLAVHGYCESVTPDGERHPDFEYPMHYRPDATRTTLEDIKTVNIIPTPGSVLIHREILDRIGGFKAEFSGCEDWDYWLRLCLESDIFLIQKVVLRYVRHSGSLSLQFDMMSEHIEKMRAEIPGLLALWKRRRGS